jgi:23S rRNA pseudouridine1911/1915/1917 synthase
VKILVSAEDNGLRLDKWLGQLDIVSSRTRAAELIERGLVTLQGKALKPSHKVQTGTEISVELPPLQPMTLQPLDRPLDILYEDEDLVVVNKPAGLVVHPAAGHAQDTLVNILLHHVGRLSMGFSEQRPGIVHRLDRDTSGVLVVAKNDSAHHALSAQFRLKTAHRIYWALVHGAPRSKTGTFKTHLARHPQDRKRFASNPFGQGKLAITHYSLLESRPSHISWLRCQLETGRTHQIRVHLSEAGLPILGDPIYGKKTRDKNDLEAGRLALHAVELGFTHPRTQAQLFFKAGWPAPLADFVIAKGFQNVPA